MSGWMVGRERFRGEHRVADTGARQVEDAVWVTEVWDSPESHQASLPSPLSYNTPV